MHAEVGELSIPVQSESVGALLLFQTPSVAFQSSLGDFHVQLRLLTTAFNIHKLLPSWCKLKAITKSLPLVQTSLIVFRPIYAANLIENMLCVGPSIKGFINTIYHFI